jgi:hypothetical protein
LSTFWVPAIASIELCLPLQLCNHLLNAITQKGKQGNGPGMEADDHTPTTAGVWSYKVSVFVIVVATMAQKEQ